MTLSPNNHRQGFTLVELLIVIVVIAILAAIVVVSYNGVQNRAYDTTVKSDTRNFIKKIELFRVEQGRYPNPTVRPVFEELVSLEYRASKNAYQVEPEVQRNLVYCTSPARDQYALAVKSKSGNAFYASNQTGSDIVEFTSTWGAGTWSADICGSPQINLSESASNQTSGYIPAEAGWQSWTGLR